MSRTTAILLSSAVALIPVLPSPPPAEAARKQARAVVRVGQFTFHSDQTQITLPLRGAKPQWRVVHERGARVAYLEIPADGTLIARTGRTQSLNPSSGLLERILFAQNRPGVVRIAVRGREAVRMLPELIDEGRTLRIRFSPFDAPVAPVRPTETPQPVVPPTPRPTPSPTPVPSPTAAPPEPSPEVTPEPTFEPVPSVVALPAPFPSAAPTPRPEVPEEPEPPSRIEFARYQMAFSEDYAAGMANNIRIPNAGVSELTWTQHLDDNWRSRLNFRHWDEYTIIDVDLTDSRHFRNENWLEAGLERRAQTGPVAHALGFGYYMRDVRVRNTMEAIAPEYLFSGYQFYHGLTLADTMTLRLWGPFRLVGSVQVRPLNFVHVEEGVPEMPWLLAGGGDLGLEYSQRLLGHWLTARLSQRYETFQQTTFVPFQTLTMTTLSLGYRF